MLVSYSLASDWASAASNGSKAFSSTPISGTASGTGTAEHFRIYSSANVCHWQGTVGTSGTDIIIDNTSIAIGQAVNITSFSITAGNA